MSPTPSAYGVSPTTTTPTSEPAVAADALPREGEVRVRCVGLHALEDRRTDVVVARRALPRHGPAAGLVAEVVAFLPAT